MTTLQALQPRYFEDVKVGDELAGYSMDITWTKIAEHVSGSQDFYPVHHDPDFAHSGGHKEIFVNTGFTRSLLFRLLTDWIGPDGWVRTFSFQMRRMNILHDTIRVKGKIVGKEKTAEGNAVNIELWIENDREGVATPGTAVVLLPSRP